MSKNSVSLDNFLGEQFEVNGVNLHGDFELPPYVPTSDISVDLGRLSNVARIGRLEGVTIWQYTEQQETVQPIISGIDDQGTATGSASKSTTKVHRASVDNQRAGKHRLSRGTATIKINTNHPDLDDSNLRSAETWSPLLDSGLREGLRSANFNHMVAGRGLIDKGLATFWAALWTRAITESIQETTVSPGLVSTSVAVGVSSVAIAGLCKSLFGEFDYEWTTTPGLAFDRLATVQALTRTQKIIKTKRS